MTHTPRRWIWAIVALIAAVATGWLLFSSGRALWYVLAVLVLGVAIIQVRTLVPESRRGVRTAIAALGAVVLLVGWFGPVVGDRLRSTGADVVAEAGSEPFERIWHGNAISLKSSFDLQTLSRTDVLTDGFRKLGPIDHHGQPVLVSVREDPDGWTLRGATPDGSEAFLTDTFALPDDRLTLLAHRDDVLVLGGFRDAQQVVWGIDLRTGEVAWTKDVVTTSPMLALTDPTYTDWVTPSTMAVRVSGKSAQRYPGDGEPSAELATWDILDVRSGQPITTIQAGVLVPVGDQDRMLSLTSGMDARTVQVALFTAGKQEWQVETRRPRTPVAGALVDHDGALAVGSHGEDYPSGSSDFQRLIGPGGEPIEGAGEVAGFGGPVIDADSTSVPFNHVVTATDDAGNLIWEHTGDADLPLWAVWAATTEVVAVEYHVDRVNPYRDDPVRELLLLDRHTGELRHRVVDVDRFDVLADGTVIAHRDDELHLYRP